MNLKNLLTLTIRVEDYNLVARKPELLQKLRELTIRPTSGMNHELNAFAKISRIRPVQCKILMAYRSRQLVGWAILSKEDSSFYFPFSARNFKANDGSLFEVYVHPSYRRQGIASELLKKAKKYATDGLCVAPHDVASHGLYDKLERYHNKRL